MGCDANKAFWIGHVPHTTSVFDIFYAFHRFGLVADIRFAKSPASIDGVGYKYGFVWMLTHRGAEKVREEIGLKEGSKEKVRLTLKDGNTISVMEYSNKVIDGNVPNMAAYLNAIDENVSAVSKAKLGTDSSSGEAALEVVHRGINSLSLQSVSSSAFVSGTDSSVFAQKPERIYDRDEILLLRYNPIPMNLRFDKSMDGRTRSKLILKVHN